MTEKQNTAPAEKKNFPLATADNFAAKKQVKKFFKPKRNKGNFPLQKTSKQNGEVKHLNFKPHKQALAEKLVKTFHSLVSKGLRTLLPWTFLSFFLFTAGAYLVFHYGIAGHNYPLWYVITASVILFAFYGITGLIYGLSMGFLYTVKDFSQTVGSLVRETINRIKNSLESKVDKAADTLSKNQAAQVVKQTFDDLSKNIHKYAAKTAAGVMVLTVLGGVLFFFKKTLLLSLNKIKNKADFFAILSARAALVVAIILNLTFFIKLAIAAGYLLGLLGFAGQAVLILLTK